ncbi:MAG: gamma-glutamyltransferase [Thermomicrobiales bacterium]
MSFPSPSTYRPPVIGSRYMASTGHYLATQAAVRILERGGNAFDAGVAAGLCINVLQPDMTNIGGIAPVMVYDAATSNVSTVSGLGYWPAAASADYFINDCDYRFPPGVRRCVMPAAMDSWLTTLRRWGSMTFREGLGIRYRAGRRRLRDLPVPPCKYRGGRQPDSPMANNRLHLSARRRRTERRNRLIQSELAATLEALGDAEREAGGNRETGIDAARAEFYCGDIAGRIAGFMADNDGWMTMEDLEGFRVEVDEKPPSVTYRGHEVFGCGPWCQGPVALQTLAILDGYDMGSFEPGSADSLHLILEALKASFADREQFVGDTNFVDVPLEGMLSSSMPQSGASGSTRPSPSGHAGSRKSVGAHESGSDGPASISPGVSGPGRTRHELPLRR